MSKERKDEPEPVDIIDSIKVSPKEEDINVNLDSKEHNIVEDVNPLLAEKDGGSADASSDESSSAPFDTLEFIKFILFRILNIIYSRFFDVVNDFSSVYSEAFGKLK